MEQVDVAAAIAALRRAGQVPSVDNIRKLLCRGSCREIARHRRALCAAVGTTTAPAPVDVAQDDH
jgi:Plasmid replication region DNA-binding N-term